MAVTAAAAAAAALALSACALGAEAAPAQAAPTVLVGSPTAPGSPHDLALAAYQQMSAAQRVGQLFMVALPSTGTTRAERRELWRLRIGNAMLFQHTDAGVDRTAKVAAALRRVTTHATVGPLVATDQEGGEVQDLNGSGFSDIPSALVQGTYSLSTLRADAEQWGGQLLRAGVNLDFAPVADVVPKSVGTSNQPIGRYDREYGYTPRRVRRHVVAFIGGMRADGTMTTVKHFPGLGRATGNTDVTAGVTDPTTRHDRYLAPFRAGINAGVPLVMVSTASYPNIDPDNKAVFSHRIMTGMLRHDLGFTGTVVSDALTTVSLQGIRPAQRARWFISSGGDIVLLTSIAPLKAMVHAVRSHADASTAFRMRVRRAVVHVLTTKAQAGLL
jgi:beta-N-acetylhexosaminidase